MDILQLIPEIDTFLYFLSLKKISLSQYLFYNTRYANQFDLFNYVHPFFFISSYLLKYLSYQLYFLLFSFLICIFSSYLFYLSYFKRLIVIPWFLSFLLASILISHIIFILFFLSACFFYLEKNKNYGVYTFILIGLLISLVVLFYTPFLILLIIFSIIARKNYTRIIFLYCFFITFLFWFFSYWFTEAFSERFITYFMYQIKTIFIVTQNLFALPNFFAPYEPIFLIFFQFYWFLALIIFLGDFIRNFKKINFLHPFFSKNKILYVIITLFLVNIFLPIQKNIFYLVLLSITFLHHLFIDRIIKVKVIQLLFLFPTLLFFIMLISKIEFNFNSSSAYKTNNQDCKKRVWVISMQSLKYLNIKVSTLNQVLLLDLKMIPQKINLAMKLIAHDKTSQKMSINETQFLNAETKYANYTLSNLSKYKCLGILVNSAGIPLYFEKKPYTRARIFYNLFRENKNIIIIHR